MPACSHFKCRREELPHAVGFPTFVPAACAHVNPKGEPCPESPQIHMYDEESYGLIMTDRTLWDPELWSAESEPEEVRAEAPAESLPDPPDSFIMAPMERAARELGVDLSSGHSVDGDQAATEVALDTSTTGAEGIPLLAGSNPAPGTKKKKRAQKTPASPAKPRKSAQKKAPEPPPAADDDDDLDDWEP